MSAMKDYSIAVLNGDAADDTAIARQLKRIPPDQLAAELAEYGAWDDEELADHAANLERFVWIAAGNIVEESRR